MCVNTDQYLQYIGAVHYIHHMHARNCHINSRNSRHSFGYFAQFAASQGPTKGSSGAHLAKMHIEPGLSRLIQSHSRREGGCGELGKPIRSDERCPQPFELQIQMRCSLSVRDVKRRGAAQNPRANPHGHLALGSSGARTVVWWLFRPACFMPMRPESKIRTAHSPITSEFPSSRLQRTVASSTHRFLDQRGAD